MGLYLSPLSSFLTFRKTARNFNQPMCKAAKTTIVEVRPSRKQCVSSKLTFSMLSRYFNFCTRDIFERIS